MKKFLFICLLISLTGCTIIRVPKYIQDSHPYRKNFYGNFDTVLSATTQTIDDFGWKIAGTSDPVVFEKSRELDDLTGKQIVLFTEIRQTALFLGTRYSRLNAFLRTVDENTTEVELRYITVTSIPFKSFYNYKKDGVIKRIFLHIEQRLN